MKKETNKAIISGEIIEEFCQIQGTRNAKLFSSKIKVYRISGVADIIPIIISGKLLNDNSWKGKFVWIEGEFRSHNKRTKDGNKVSLYVCPEKFRECLPFESGDNSIILDGFLCKNPIYRSTKRGWEISDMMVAVNRPNGGADYIPCISWGMDARYAETLDIGTHLKITGRIQSREYFKRIDNEYFEQRTAYEVSVSQMEVMESEEYKD